MTADRYAIIVPLTATTADELHATIASAMRAHVDQPTATLEVAADAPILLRYREVADLLGVSLSAVEVMVARGDLPVVHIGKCARVRRADLDAYVASLPTWGAR